MAFRIVPQLLPEVSDRVLKLQYGPMDAGRTLQKNIFLLGASRTSSSGAPRALGFGRLAQEVQLRRASSMYAELARGVASDRYFFFRYLVVEHKQLFDVVVCS